MCTDCPNISPRFIHREPPLNYKIRTFSCLLQIDFIDPLLKLQKKYACTIVDTETGLEIARECKHPNQDNTISIYGHGFHSLESQ